MPRNLVLLFDGTWNNSIQKGDADSSIGPNIEIDDTSTNIARMWSLLEKSERQQLIYQRGVATDGDWGDKIDGWFGLQVNEKVDEASEAIRSHAKPGDRLFLFGFSRGAATARLVARELESDPLIQNKRIEVPFMGIFDTVASMGFPGLAMSDSSYLGYRKGFHDLLDDLAIPGFVRNVVHLIAMHEDRSVFAPTFAIATAPASTKIKEVWMGGNHSDIGGGWKDEQEQDKEYRRRMISLRYMLTEAKSNGLFLQDDWDKHPDVRVDEENHWQRCGQIHGWKDYPFFDRINGRMTRSPHELPHGASTPIIHKSANK
jgi:uncharacterized protein (DUF2235 family)